MNRIIDGYVFSKDERQMIPASICFLLLLLVVLGIVTYAFSMMPHQIFGIFAAIILLVLVCLGINHMRYKKYRTARYRITDTSISMRYGDIAIKIDTNDDYYISILQLYKSSGKAYSYHPYIVLWRGAFPINAVHPFELIKKNNIILPFSDSLTYQVKLFINQSEIPNYPKLLHHDEVTKSNEILMF